VKIFHTIVFTFYVNFTSVSIAALFCWYITAKKERKREGFSFEYKIIGFL